VLTQIEYWQNYQVKMGVAEPKAVPIAPPAPKPRHSGRVAADVGRQEDFVVGADAAGEAGCSGADLPANFPGERETEGRN
jgi:hypothetical protein